MIDPKDLSQIVRLSLSGQVEDVQLFVARLVRKYKSDDPELANDLELSLASRAAHSATAMRRVEQPKSNAASTINPIPVDLDSRISLLKKVDIENTEAPFFSSSLNNDVNQIIKEWKKRELLLAEGLKPTTTAIFTGSPGVGKTITAKWIASNLKMPLYVIDLATIMSSLLGKTGNNLRAAFDFADQTPCVLLLDEIDAIAKTRGDDSDVGELKRLVTVILQEIDSWSGKSILLAATNHPELIDRALWRRFDAIIDFEKPDDELLLAAIKKYAGKDWYAIEKWDKVLHILLRGSSYSDVKRTIFYIRKMMLLGDLSIEEILGLIAERNHSLYTKKDQVTLAKILTEKTELSQHKIASITSLSRSTVRKHTKNQDV